jgi:hypothetical protein
MSNLSDRCEKSKMANKGKTTKSSADMPKKLEADTSKKSDVEPNRQLSEWQIAGNIFVPFFN